MAVNESEKFVRTLCDRSFLVPWVYMNPVGQDGKELADAVVCVGSVVILISVKDYRPRAETDLETAGERWERKTIDHSIKQLSGAKRRIARGGDFLEPLSSRQLQLPPPSKMRVFLVAIAFGGSSYGRFGSRETGKGFVHVFDDSSVVPHFLELSTATEFIDYLSWRSDAQEVIGTETCGAPEEDWLGFYLLQDEQAVGPRQGDFQRLIKRSGTRNQFEMNELSLFWDKVITHVWMDRSLLMANSTLDGRVTPLSEVMMASILQQMSLHPRAERRALGTYAESVFAGRSEVSARVLKLQKGPGYVLECVESTENKESLSAVLVARCIYVQEHLMPDRNVIGIAATSDIGTLNPKARMIFCYLENSVGTEEIRLESLRVAKELGIFQEVRAWELPHELFGIRLEDV